MRDLQGLAEGILEEITDISVILKKPDKLLVTPKEAVDAMLFFYKKASKDMFEREFIEWIIDKNSPVAICYGSKTPFATTYKDYTLDELYYYWQVNIKNK